MPDTVLAFVDVETTGLDPRIHQPYEVSIWLERHGAPITIDLPHTLLHADRKALAVGDYWLRGFGPWTDEGQALQRLLHLLRQTTTIVGSSPQFDTAMLTRFIGCDVWDHRLIDVSQGGMWVFGWDRPHGLATTAEACREAGYDIPAPDHTAEGDVRATRAIYNALQAIRGAS